MRGSIRSSPGSALFLHRLCVWFAVSLLVGCAAGTAQQADDGPSFEAVEIEHPSDIEMRPALSLRNQEGFRLSLLRSSSGQVHGLFELSRRPEFLAEGRSVVLVPEARPAREPFRLDGSITWVEFVVWDGEGEAVDGDLRDLMDAEAVEVRYFLEGGGYKSTTFPLTGLRDLAAETYGIPSYVSAQQREAASRRRQLLEDAAARCQALKRKKRDQCLATARSCLDTATADLDALQTCLEPGG